MQKETQHGIVHPTIGTKSFYYRLQIHPSVKSIRDYWDSTSSDAGIKSSSRDVLAFCLMYEKPAGRCIGEIILAVNTPVNIIVHECLHALLHWGKLKNLNIYHAEEDFCFAMQCLVKNVLRKYKKINKIPTEKFKTPL